MDPNGPNRDLNDYVPKPSKRKQRHSTRPKEGKPKRGGKKPSYIQTIGKQLLQRGQLRPVEPLPTQASGQRLGCQLSQASTISLRTQQVEALV